MPTTKIADEALERVIRLVDARVFGEIAFSSEWVGRACQELIDLRAAAREMITRYNNTGDTDFALIPLRKALDD